MRLWHLLAISWAMLIGAAPGVVGAATSNEAAVAPDIRRPIIGAGWLRRRLARVVGPERLDRAWRRSALRGGDSREGGRLLPAVARIAWQRRFAAELARRFARIDPQVMPEDLPALPAPTAPDLARIVAQARAQSADRRAQWAELEQLTGALRGDRDADRRARGEVLALHVRRAKSHAFAAASAPLGHWLGQRLRRFGRVSPVPWDLVGALELPPARQRRRFDAEAEALLRQRLRAAWGVIVGAIHPEVLRRVPPVRVVVDPRGKRCRYRRPNVLVLVPGARVRSILHEFGHHLERTGDFPIAGMARGFLSRRTHGRRLATLGKLDPKRRAQRRAKVYEGAFVRPYMGRYYPRLSTEIVSTGMEYLRNRRQARKLFLRDGEHLLLLLSRLQHPQAPAQWLPPP